MHFVSFIDYSLFLIFIIDEPSRVDSRLSSWNSYPGGFAS
jgi:hypothetical protein